MQHAGALAAALAGALVLFEAPARAQEQPQAQPQTPAPLPQAQGLACYGLQKPQQVAELWFGRKIHNERLVSDGAFRRFVAREITPRFPDGLTIIEARGQWLDTTTKRVIREPSSLVVIAIAGTPEDHERLSAVAEAYKKAFRQQSVAIIVRPACVSF